MTKKIPTLDHHKVSFHQGRFPIYLSTSLIANVLTCLMRARIAELPEKFIIEGSYSNGKIKKLKHIKRQDNNFHIPDLV